MTRLFTTISLIAVLAAGTAAAQSPPAGQAPEGAPPEAGQPGAGSPPGGGSQATSWPIAYAVSVEVVRGGHGGRDIVIAHGLVTSEGWSQPHLIPITSGKPIDGVLDLLFQAQAPQTPAPLGAFMEVDAMLPLGHEHPYKAVRVRSATNALNLKEMPGYHEVRKLKNDCTKCIGKYFVAKGGTPPAGVAADQIVKEEDLIWRVRVIKPTEGIPSYTLDPNRLTVVLTEDGRIADAAWD
jgi:hypothetical protein